MYGALFRALPGPTWFRVILMVVLFAAVVAALFLWVFPWVSTLLPEPDTTVDAVVGNEIPVEPIVTEGT